MKDPNKYGVYWIANKNGEPIEYGLMCVAEDEHYAEIIRTALSSITENTNELEYIVALDYPN